MRWTIRKHGDYQRVEGPDTPEQPMYGSAVEVVPASEVEWLEHELAVKKGEAAALWPKVAEVERLREALREVRALDVNDGLTDAEAFDCVQTIAEAALADDEKED